MKCTKQSCVTVSEILLVLLICTSAEILTAYPRETHPENISSLPLTNIAYMDVNSEATIIVFSRSSDDEIDEECISTSDCPINSYCCQPQDNDCNIGQCMCNEKYEFVDGECVSSSDAYKMVTTIALVVSLILISAIVIAFACYIVTYMHVRCQRREPDTESTTTEQDEDVDEPPTYSEVQSQDEKPPTYQEYISSITKADQGTDNSRYTNPFYNPPSTTSDQPCSSEPILSPLYTEVILDPTNVVLPDNKPTDTRIDDCAATENFPRQDLPPYSSIYMT